jgi:tRNA-specific 2-thiouridylase
MLRLWSASMSQDVNRCCTPDATALAKHVASVINIPFYVIDARQQFYDLVVKYFINEYHAGKTPNPCVVCNPLIRWGLLLDHSLAFGADYFATGHYARIQRHGKSEFQLLQGIDRLKDQSYVLYRLNQSQLAKTLFPVGTLTKFQVREIARTYNLPTANRSDSQDLCFLGDDDYRVFLDQNTNGSPVAGSIVNTNGDHLGWHNGLFRYTIGQRKKLGISSPTPLYVINKDIEKNLLIVGNKEETFDDQLYANQVTWISGQTVNKPIHANVKIRYNAEIAEATITPDENDKVFVKFNHPVGDITPGQSTVFYQNEVCLGGGIIHFSKARLQ